MTACDRLRQLLAERIVVLDGAWGTMIQDAGLVPDDYRGERFRDNRRDVAGDPDVLALTRPDVMRGIHDAYLAAGADITTTNTFTATSIGQADYGLEQHVREINVAAARIAREACEAAATPERPRFVAGSIGPLNVTLSMSPKVDDPAYRAVAFEQVRDAYGEQISALWASIEHAEPLAVAINGYAVIDLGVMVPAETILYRAWSRASSSTRRTSSSRPRPRPLRCARAACTGSGRLGRWRTTRRARAFRARRRSAGCVRTSVTTPKDDSTSRRSAARGLLDVSHADALSVRVEVVASAPCPGLAV
jgi:hypothetical protein